MRVVAVSDLHPDANTAGFPRFDDVAKALDTAVKHAIEVKADAFIFAGDLVTNDPSLDLAIRCVTLAQDAAYRFARADVRSWWMVGNHDVFEDGLGTTALDPLEYVEGEVWVAKNCELVQATEDGEGILFFPFVPLSHAYDPVERTEVMRDRAKNLNIDVKLIVSHLMLEGIGPGSETNDMPRGRDVFLPVDELRALFPGAVILNGHYHHRQTYRGVEVIGSLVRLTRGERDNTPCFLDLDL